MKDAVKTTLKTKYGGSLENSIRANKRANKLLLSKFCEEFGAENESETSKQNTQLNGSKTTYGDQIRVYVLKTKFVITCHGRIRSESSQVQDIHNMKLWLG